MKSLIATALLLTAAAASAAPQSATLSVPTMSCATCPTAIKAALSKVPGVSSVKSDLSKRQTTVVYDDTKTGVAALSKATAEAGFPSTFLNTAK